MHKNTPHSPVWGLTNFILCVIIQVLNILNKEAHKIMSRHIFGKIFVPK